MTSESIPYYIVDAFASRPYAGNPAAVCPLPRWLDDAALQAIAAENNLSETAFLVVHGNAKVEAGAPEFELRWFTPKIEVDLCGHATLAAGWVVTRHLRPEAKQARFHTKSGLLSVARQGEKLALDFPAKQVEPADRGLSELVAEAIDHEPVEVLRNGKIMAVLDSAAAVRAIRPDFAKVAALEGNGLIVTAMAGAGERPADFVSRYFAPHAGIDEDPVTGAAHCLLVPYWAQRLRKNSLHALQVSERGGELFCTNKGSRVILAGNVVPYAEGRIFLATERRRSQAA